MPDVYETGTIWSTTLPKTQRDYYEALLLDTLRMQSILVPYCAVKEDFTAVRTKVIHYTEIYDLSPNWNSITEQSLWLPGSYLDTRSVTINLEWHGDVVKFSDDENIANYLGTGDFRGICRGKLGQSMIDHLDILARNAFFGVHDNYKYFAGGKTFYTLLQTDYFDPDYAEIARIHLEEREIPGVGGTQDGDGQTIVCVTTPRVCYDIRLQANNWLEVQEYAGATRKFTNEVGMWGGIRFVKTNRNKLWNHGKVTLQTTLDGDTAKGQGAAASVDNVYTVGQTTIATPYITVADESGFVIDDVVTVHSHVAVGDDGAGGAPPVVGDGTQETLRIVDIDADNNRVSFDKPLLKPHSDGNYMTKGVTPHLSFFMGGPSVVYGVAERPNLTTPPTIDDLMMLNRLGWRGLLKFQMFRPEFLEVAISGGSTV